MKNSTANMRYFLTVVLVLIMNMPSVCYGMCKNVVQQKNDIYNIDSIDKLYVTDAHLAKKRIDLLQRRCESNNYKECSRSRLENVYGFICIYLHDPTSSIHHANKAFTAAKAEKNIPNQLMALQLLIDNELEIGFNRLATEHIRQMYELANKVDDPYKKFYVTSVYSYMADNNKSNNSSYSIALLDKALNESRGVENERNLLYEFTFEKAKVYYQHQEYSKAYKTDMQVIGYLDEDEPKLLGGKMNTYGGTDKAGFDIFRLYVHSHLTLVCLKMGQKVQARNHYLLCKKLMQKYSDVPQIQVTIAQYLDLAGENKQLINFATPLIDTLNVSKRTLILLNLLLHSYLVSGKTKEAAEIYDKYVKMENTLRARTSDCAFEEINIAYSTAELKKANAIQRMSIIFGSVFIGLLMTLFAVLIVNHRKLRKLYRMACERIDEFIKLQQNYDLDNREEQQNSNIEMESLTMFRLLDTKMKKEKPYLSNEFNSADLHTFAGVGRHKFEDILRCSCGMTPAKYLSSLRIEHAIHLMKEFPYYSLEAISEQSGFSTERSFYRIFSDLFGITPNTYRKTLK